MILFRFLYLPQITNSITVVILKEQVNLILEISKYHKPGLSDAEGNLVSIKKQVY